MELEKVIIAPVLSEKSTMLRENDLNKYVFKVHLKANKIEIKKAVRAFFNVEPVSCNIINVRGRKKPNIPVTKKNYKRGYGVTSSWKKAVVTLAAGQKIASFEGM